ncbi:MAG: DUF262 domain-containing protein [Treponema sp.]|nr:DUF262 domain-containing protein [Treponema sp.]
MEIEPRKITIRQLTEGYEDNAENGVKGFAGKLDIRPPYQREFVYNENQRDLVIDSIVQNFPLNVMYWAERSDGTFEVMDGQQRTISVCQYVAGDFAHCMRYFHNLQEDEKNQILDYELNVYICRGTDSEKLNWFRRINVAGEKLTEQEILNAVYSGSWVTDAKNYFSKNGCVAYKVAGDYVNGSPIRQDFLETAIKWISRNNIEEYMACHQNDPNALALWQYFSSIFTWVEGTFKHTKERKKIMKGVDWAELYNNFKDVVLDTNKIETEIEKLILDDDVNNKKGIFHFVLTRNEKYLSIRTFSDSQKVAAYEKQKGICANPNCPDHNKHFELSEMEADHITPWSQGGKTTLENCQMLCRECNRRKSDR